MCNEFSRAFRTIISWLRSINMLKDYMSSYCLQKGQICACLNLIELSILINNIFVIDFYGVDISSTIFPKYMKIKNVLKQYENVLKHCRVKILGHFNFDNHCLYEHNNN